MTATTAGAGPAGATPEGSPLLALEDVHVVLGGHGAPSARAVDGVHLQVRRGEIVALAGESGCGKTTLARTVLGLQRPTSGRVLVDGVELGTSRAELRAWRRRVQLVPQDPTGSLNPRRTVYEAVAEGLRIHRIPAETGRREDDLVAEALERAGLRPAERFVARYPAELSGGQRQRVLIAGALAVGPELLVADEPVSSLDASVRGTILALLLRLRDELGLSVLVVTHDLGLAWNIADRLAVMYLGRVVEAGPTEEVLADPQHPYTQALLSVVPETGRLEPVVLRGEPPDATAIPAGCRFHPRCPALAAGPAAGVGDGLAARCRSEALPLLPPSAGHTAACLLRDAEAQAPGNPASVPDDG
ncbi:ABC transporter ATP-binding protein [Kineosporia sp. A_224]|uniref:ABC transporter ATP-binding protein n=1 Tax=Kineosporia sp. A_224 TaxID=1962180 RepID=UPI000B4B74E5|nr:ABC transporter ATP-binding protein [Kineosporia sp. A_224]